VVGPVVASGDDDTIAVSWPHIEARIGRFVRLDTARTTGPFADVLAACGLATYDIVTP
jgi:hypothetical protein